MKSEAVGSSTDDCKIPDVSAASSMPSCSEPPTDADSVLMLHNQSDCSYKLDAAATSSVTPMSAHISSSFAGLTHAHPTTPFPDGTAVWPAQQTVYVSDEQGYEIDDETAEYEAYYRQQYRLQSCVNTMSALRFADPEQSQAYMLDSQYGQEDVYRGQENAAPATLISDRRECRDGDSWLGDNVYAHIESSDDEADDGYDAHNPPPQWRIRATRNEYNARHRDLRRSAMRSFAKDYILHNKQRLKPRMLQSFRQCRALMREDSNAIADDLPQEALLSGFPDDFAYSTAPLVLAVDPDDEHEKRFLRNRQRHRLQKEREYLAQLNRSELLAKEEEMRCTLIAMQQGQVQYTQEQHEYVKMQLLRLQAMLNSHTYVYRNPAVQDVPADAPTSAVIVGHDMQGHSAAPTTTAAAPAEMAP